MASNALKHFVCLGSKGENTETQIWPEDNQGLTGKARPSRQRKEKKRKQETILDADWRWKQDPLEGDKTEGKNNDISDDDGGGAI